MPTVSVIIPCLNHAMKLHSLHARLREEFARLEISVELIFVDDGSIDTTRIVLREIAMEDAECRVIIFRRTSGLAAVLQAGFAVAQGEMILTLGGESEVQHISRVLEALQQADVVCGSRNGQAQPLAARWMSRLIGNVTDARLRDHHCPLKGYRRQVIREVSLSGEAARLLPLLARTRGFRVQEILIDAPGMPEYHWNLFLDDLYDLVGIAYRTKYRARPMRLFGGLGLGCTLFGLALAAVLSPHLTIYGPPPPWHFFMWLLALAFVILGPVFIALGVIAEGQFAASPIQPDPPVAERINCIAEDTTLV